MATPIKILVVDDELEVQNTLETFLESIGYSVNTASDGIQALDILQKENFDVALIDINMPKMNGYDLLKSMKEQNISTVPIILSCLSEVSDITNAIKLGAFDYLEKPSSRKAIEAAIEKAYIYRNANSLALQMTTLAEETEAILDALSDMIVVINNDGIILHCNKAILDSLHIQKELVLGKPYSSTVGLFDEYLKVPTKDIFDSSTTYSIYHPKWNKHFKLMRYPLNNGQDGITGFVYVYYDVTKPTTFQKALKESEERYRILFEGSHDAMMTIAPPSWKFTSGNPAAIKLFGAKDHAEFISLGPWDISPESQPDGQLSSDKSKQMINKAMQEGSNFFEWTHKQISGKEFPCTVLLTRLEANGESFIQATVRDIASEKQVESALRESERKYRSLVDNIRMGILLISPQMRILALNKQMQHWFSDINIESEPVCYRAFNEPTRELPCSFCPTYKTFQDGKVNETEANIEDRIFRIVSSPIKDDNGNITAAIEMLEDITERKLQEGKRILLETAVNHAAEMVLVTNENGIIQYVNPTFEKITGYQASEVIGLKPSILSSGKQSKEFYAKMWKTLAEGKTWTGSLVNKKKNEILIEQEATISSVLNNNGKITNYVAVMRDVTEKVSMQKQLSQSQKLETIGGLAAGIAHEINTPIQYVGDNVRFLSDACKNIKELIHKFIAVNSKLKNMGNFNDIIEPIDKYMKEMDVDYLLTEVPLAIEQSLEGVERVSNIVRAMKEFAHPDLDEKVHVDLNRMIETTITVARNEWKYVADLETELDPNLPTVPCYPGDINQVLLNIIVNAAHSIGDVVKDSPGKKGKIIISTSRLDKFAEIKISDTGTGIPEHIKDRIFDPFFTTKEVGKGSGQGLAISHSFIVDKHKGFIDFETQTGKGVVFIIKLPFS